MLSPRNISFHVKMSFHNGMRHQGKGCCCYQCFTSQSVERRDAECARDQKADLHDKTKTLPTDPQLEVQQRPQAEENTELFLRRRGVPSPVLYVVLIEGIYAQ